MKISRITPQSIAAETGLRVDDEIVRINGEPVRDAIDYEFWIHDTPLIITVKRQDDYFDIEFEHGLSESLGVEFEPMRYRCCGNHCVFCFVDQNPPNLRQTLYFKDEDYRLSFLYGNYITLTNTGKRDLQRIVEQRLSPLYISVHAVDKVVRAGMLGLKKDDHLMQKVAFLAENGIEMHAQVVLCPGWNDGSVLEDTVQTLASFYPALRSLAIVPVGLTRHRQGLVPLQPVTPEIAKAHIKWNLEQIKVFQNRFGSNFLYLADEFFLMSQTDLPVADYYEDFGQIENGIGLMRAFIDQFSDDYDRIKSKLRGLHFSVVTAELAVRVWETNLLPRLLNLGNTVHLYSIENEFYGESITVTGLLCARDIAMQLRHKPLGDFILLPANVLNHDGLFLDDWTPADLESALGTPVFVANDDLHFMDKLEEQL